ncbi:MAG: 50S ribosomal protein L23 [Alphaproteobacteria bacterium CG11_big_fil_rev_8_21_14_0_20_44_7]|nr:MAG: 50S ribosomal protein L23 [Alphaproteobacteria bacterium CG11_big_fil_rev_8_21_14_0_20_44_7]
MAKAKKTVSPRSYEVITAPVITEKATIANSLGKYIFQVPVSAHKKEIKTAVEEIFNVEVTKVNTIKYDGKIKRFRGKLGQRNAFKKAIVSLKEGQSIDLAGGV